MRGVKRVEGSRSGASAAVALLCVALTVLTVGVGVAQAERKQVFERAFGAGDMSLREASEAAAGSGVAVSSTSHDVYVADTQNHRVDEFGPDGSFVRAWGWGVGLGIGFERCTLACQPGIEGSGPGQFEAPAFVAVDNSSGPSAGDVYVGDTKNNVISKFTAEGVLVKSWGVEGQLKGSPTGGGGTLVPFGELSGITIDSAGTLDVLENTEDELFEFAQEGAFSTSFETPRGSQPAGLAVNTTGDFFKANGDGSVEEFAAGGTNIGQVTPNNTAAPEQVHPAGVAVDGDDLFVLEAERVKRYTFNGSGEVVQPAGAACTVRPNPEDLEGFGCGPTETFGSPPDPAGGSGVGVDDSSGDVLVTDATSGQVEVFIPQPPAPPVVEDESISDVSNDAATFQGSVDPEGATTNVHFQYGPCVTASTCGTSGYPDNGPSAGVGSEFAVANVPPTHVQGLNPGTTYHFRLVAENEPGLNAGGPTLGREVVFTTSGTGELGLPDGRKWVMVSPPDKHGALIEPIGQDWTIQAAASGGALTYVTDAPTESNPEGYVLFQQILSTRGPQGWSSRDIEPPHNSVTEISAGQGQEFRLFSEDLSSAVVQPAGKLDPADSAEASEQTAFRRTNFSSSSPSEPCTSSCMQPLVTAAPGFANVSEGTVFGEEENCPRHFYCGPKFVGGSPDLNHVILNSIEPLTTGAPAGNLEPGGLYEWSAGKAADEQLSLVGVLPNGEAVEGLLGSNGAQNTRGAVSEDGSRVVWIEHNGGHLYLRVNATKPQSPLNGEACTVEEDACTLELDKEVEELGGTPGSPEFQLASKGVGAVLFTDGGDLYEYVVAERHLKRLTENAEVLGSVIGAGPDDSFIYFVAQGVLGDAGQHGATQGNCTAADASDASQHCNLYVSNDGTVKLVSVLSGEDFPDWAFIGTGANLSRLTARVSPNGEWLAFMSQRSLTGYDNRDAISGQPDEEVFEYSAASERVVCASCDPTGARPHGIEYGKEGNAGFGEEMRLSGGFGVWPGTTWLAANVPGWTPYSVDTALYQSRYLSDEGRLFFNSRDGLVPKDVNGQEDVYEFEPGGVGSCGPLTSTGSDVYVGALAGSPVGGCVALISSGSSAQESAFLDASESGGDVFFLTTSQLAPQDSDDALDIYDAQECTVSVPCPAASVESPEPCHSESECKGEPAGVPDIFGAAGSQTVTGAGNFVAPAVVAPKPKPKTAAQIRAERLAKALSVCRRDKRHGKRVACERLARRKYGPAKKAKRASRRGAAR
jgi:hypothetical protein